jgi:hypothetical protein
MSVGLTMNEVKSDYLDPDLLKDADAGTPAPLEPSSEGDELKTTRRPAISPPPAPPSLRAHAASVPPPVMTFSSTSDSRPRPTSEPPDAAKPSWLRALLTTTFPPPAPARHASAPAPITAQTAGTVYAVLGVLFAVVALVTGLRGAPSEVLAPSVAACLVIARAIIALGAGALSFAMFRQAERLLVEEEAPKS